MSEDPPKTASDNQKAQLTDEQIKRAIEQGEDLTIADINAEGGLANYTMPGHEPEMPQPEEVEIEEEAQDEAEVPADNAKGFEDLEQNQEEEKPEDAEADEDDTELHVEQEKRANRDSVPEETADDEPVEEGEESITPVWSCEEGEALLGGRFSTFYVKETSEGTIYYGYDPYLRQTYEIPAEAGQEILDSISARNNTESESSESVENNSDNQEAEESTASEPTGDKKPGDNIEIEINDSKATGVIGSINSNGTMNVIIVGDNNRGDIIITNGEGNDVKVVQKAQPATAEEPEEPEGPDAPETTEVEQESPIESEEPEAPDTQNDEESEPSEPVTPSPDTTETTEVEQESPAQDKEEGDYEDIVAEDLPYAGTIQHPPDPLEKQPTPTGDDGERGGSEGPPESGLEGEPGRTPSFLTGDVSERADKLKVQVGAETVSEESSGKGIKGFLKKIQMILIREGVRYKAERNWRNQEGLLSVGKTDQERQDVIEGTLTRLELLDQGLLPEDSENQERIASTDYGKKLTEGLRELVLREDIGPDELQALVDGLVRDYQESFEKDPKNKGEELLLVHNYVDTILGFRSIMQYADGIERLDSELETMELVKVKSEVKTERRSSKIQSRIAEKLEKSRTFRAVFNEPTAAFVAGCVVTIPSILTERSISSALRYGGGILSGGVLAPIFSGIAGGLVGGLRERREMLAERDLVAMSTARGEHLEGGNSDRREALEEANYKSVPLVEATADLTEAITSIESGDPDQVKQGMLTLLEMETRIRLEENRGIDLFKASDPTKHTSERLALEVSLALAKKASKQWGDQATDDECKAIGYVKDSPDGLAKMVEETSIITQILEDIDRGDDAFKKLSRQRVMTAVGGGFIVGATIGTAILELKAAVLPDLMGLADKSDSGTARTVLAWALGRELAAGKSPGKGAELMHQVQVGKSSRVSVPEGLKVVSGGRGDGFRLTDSSGNVVLDHVPVDSKGHVTPQAIAELGKRDLKISEHVQQYTAMEPRTRTTSRSVDDFIDQHRGSFTGVKRDLWYDNNTPGNFDRNELGIQWGSGGRGITENGNYVFNVSGMTEGGSFHSGASANAPGLVSKGEMMMAISVDKAHQHTPFMVPIDERGNAIIKADSPIGRALFANHNGQAVFKGAYAEAVQITGHSGGKTIMRPLATEVGSNSVQSIRDTVTNLVPVQHSRVITEITPMYKDGPTEFPFIIPVWARKGIGTNKPNEQSGQEGPGQEPTPPTQPSPIDDNPQPPSSDDDNPPETEIPVGAPPEGSDTEKPVPTPSQNPPSSTPEPGDEPKVGNTTSAPTYYMEVGGHKLRISADMLLYAMGVDPRTAQGENGEDSVITTPVPGMRYEWYSFPNPSGKRSRVLQEIDAEGNVVRPNVVLEAGDGYSYEIVENGRGTNTILVDSEGNKVFDVPEDWAGWQYGEPPLTKLEKERLQELREAMERGEELPVIDPDNHSDNLSRGDLLKGATMVYAQFKEKNESQAKSQKTPQQRAVEALTPEQLAKLFSSLSSEQREALGLTPEQAELIDQLNELDSNSQES